MPAITPSRAAVVIVALSLITFLWTFGVPRSLPTPAFPNINHDGSPWQRPDEEADEAPLKTKWFEDYIGKSSTSVTPTRPTYPTGTDFRHPGAENQVHDEDEGGHNAGQAPTPSVYPSGSIPSVPSVAPSSMPTGIPAGNETCQTAKAAGDVMIIVKTSAAELYKKVPTHLLSLLSCAPNFAIFSDHEGEIAGHKVYNALDTIRSETRSKHKEFDEYEKLQQSEIVEGKTPEKVDKELDKWKFLPMVYKAYKLRPSMRFYMFIEADTSVSWTNLLIWTQRLDYRIPYYSGAPSFLGSVRFAQRGSGILLSNGALRYYAKLYEERYESEWEKRVEKECCGDMVLATALTDSHVEFYSSFPLMQGETPETLDWTKKSWCAPIISWHKMSPSSIDALWSYQTNWTSVHGFQKPYLFRNAFYEFINPLLAERTDHWDNLSQDTKIKKPSPDAPASSKESMDWYKFEGEVRNGTDNADSCRRVCEKSEGCVQWKYRSEECVLGKVVRLGRRDDNTKEGERWTSGWMMDRIKKDQKEWGECKEPSWKFNQ